MRIREILVAVAFILFGASFANADGLITRINDSFLELKPMGAYELGASIRNGEVTLSGKVANSAMKEKITAKVKSLEGVKSLVDQVVVDPEFGVEKVSDEEVKNEVLKIEKEMGISINNLSVENGTVQVSGDLSTFQKVDEFLARVRGVKGVRGLKSKMLVNGKDYLSQVTPNF